MSKIIFTFLFFILIVSSITFASTLPSISNVTLSNNVLSWNSFSGADKYIIDLGGLAKLSTNATTQNLKTIAEEASIQSGTYQVTLHAIDEDKNIISKTWTSSYTYSSRFSKLATPTNLSWSGSNARWNSVSDAQYYLVGIYEDNTLIYKTPYSSKIENNSLDISNVVELKNNSEYKFFVQAFSNSYQRSDVSVCSTKYTVSSPSATINNVNFENNVFSWSAVSTASDYCVAIEDDNNSVVLYTNNARSFDISPFLSQTESKILKISIYAVKNINGEYIRISKTYEANVVLYKKGDLDADGDISIVDIRLLLQAYINSTPQTIWDDYDIYIMDLDENSAVNIIDVRLLLQEYING